MFAATGENGLNTTSKVSVLDLAALGPAGAGHGAVVSGFKRAPIRSFGRVMIRAYGVAVT